MLSVLPYYFFFITSNNIMPKNKAGVATSCVCRHPDDLAPFLFGGFCPECGAFDEKPFLNDWHPAMFVATAFVARYFRPLYRHFAGDMVMALIMVEIWLFNVGRFYDRAGIEDATAILQDPDERNRVLVPCNAFSISQALGIPHETVRRKIKILIDLGWISRNGNGQLMSTHLSENSYTPEMMLDFMRQFVSHARHVFSLLEIDQDGKSGDGDITAK